MFPLNFLSFKFAYFMDLCWQMPLVSTPAIGAKLLDAEGFKYRLELYKRLIVTPAKHIGQYLPTSAVNRMPQPPGIGLLTYIAPHLI
jgi:hypothetical protein